MEYIQTNIYIMHELLEEGGGCFSHEQCLVALLFLIVFVFMALVMDGGQLYVCVYVCMFNG